MESGDSLREAALRQVESWSNTYRGLPNNFDDIVEAQKHPTYEVYDEAVEALSRVRSAIERRPDTSLDF